MSAPGAPGSRRPGRRPRPRGSTVRSKPGPSARRPPRRRRGRPCRHRAEVELGLLQLQLAGLDLRRSSTSLRIASSVSPDWRITSSRSRCGGVSSAGGHRLGHAQHAVQRRADLVAHGGQERALGAVGGLGVLLGLHQRPLGLLARGDVLRSRRSRAMRPCRCGSPASPRRSRTPRRCRAARGTRSSYGAPVLVEAARSPRPPARGRADR